MYPECRHVRPAGERCRAASIKGSHWCYFHARLLQQQESRRQAVVLDRRRTVTGRFGPALPSGTLPGMDSGPGQPPSAQVQSTPLSSRPKRSEAEGSAFLLAPESAEQTLDYGAYPVPANSAPAPESIALELPAIEDSASIQLALIDVLQALAANQLDTKRAGLLLYGLQVASANARHLNIRSDSIRSITYTSNGIPLATQEHGWDIEDIEEADRLAELEEDEDHS